MSVPRDPALSQVGLLLDPEAMTPLLERSLGRPARINRVRISRVSYKPRERMSVHYRVLVDGRAEDAVARAVAGQEADALLTWLPFDPRLPALAGLPSAPRPRLLSYKPRRRAVVRLGDHVLKTYGSTPQFESAARALLAASMIPQAFTPACEAVVAPLRMTVQSAVEGEPVSSLEAASEAGELLRALQAAEIELLDPAPRERQLLPSAQRKASLIAAVAPGLARRVTSLVERLGRTEPPAARVAPAHGDFHAGQLLRVEGRLCVLDLDGLCLGAPALDLAEYVAGAGERRDAVLDALLDGYGARPDGFDWHLAAALLVRASHPFHRQLPEWPERVEAEVGIAEAVLER